MFSSILYSQAYNEPESVVYDATNDRYLVSNKGSGDIIIVPRTDPSNLSYFITGIVSSVRGITKSGGILYAACTTNNGDQYVYCFNVLTGEVTASIQIPEGQFLNDIAARDDGVVYVSDNNKIWVVNFSNGYYTTYVDNVRANGLYFEIYPNRLIYTDETPTVGSQICAIEAVVGATSTVLVSNPDFQYLDGIASGGNHYFVSAWSNNTVYRYDQNFISSEIASTGFNGIDHSGPADIYYDTYNEILAVPNFNANTVDFIPFEQLDAEDEMVPIPSEFLLHQNFPNPFNPSTTIVYELDNVELVNITVYDLLGSEIVQLVNQIEQPGSKTIRWDGRDHQGYLVNGGVYVYKLEIGNYSETKKMVFLK